MARLLSLGIACALSSLAFAQPAIFEFEYMPLGTENVFFLHATNDAGHVTRYSVHVQADESPVFLAAWTPSNVVDKLIPVTASDLLAEDWDAIPSSNLGPPMMLVPYEAADKTTYDANTNLFPAGIGTYQAGGPEHGFYVGKYEVANHEFCRFLNDAESNTNNERGANMYFSSNGYVVFNPSFTHAAKPTSNDLFDIFASLDTPITYTLTNAVGSRYRVTAGFETNPVVGVSWFGAVKYCNWLTVDEAIGSGQRSYTEGSSPADWHPITAENWPTFTDAERSEWVSSYEGFRLPMLDTNGWGPSLYNEYYKAWAWDGVTNRKYGFGRDSLSGDDANYLDSGDPLDEGTTPVGYYDGSKHGSFQTDSNNNAYAVYDLSGNVAEWLNDSVLHPALRAYKGGSFINTKSHLAPGITNASLPRLTADFVGFRVVSSIATTNPPLEIFPAGTYTAYVGGVVFFQGFGGVGAYSWSIGNTNIGTLQEDSGFTVRYKPTVTNTTQAVVLTDGASTVTTRVFQATSSGGPPIPGG